MDMQMLIVAALGIIVTFGLYHFVRLQQSRGPSDEDGYPTGTALWHQLCRIGEWTHREDSKSWETMRKLADGPMLKGFS